MTKRRTSPARYVKNIQRSGLTIYDEIEVGDPKLWIPTPELESLLDKRLRGISLAGLALRTRSKAVKQYVCEALGYPTPRAFVKTQPRFPGQLFDTYVQQSNNLQIWNEELSPTRRYVLIRVCSESVVVRVKVVTGDSLSLLDPTGTLTQKYQARCIPSNESSELVSREDTSRLARFVSLRVDLSATAATSHPTAGELLPVAAIHDRLQSLVGKSFHDVGKVQERNRGAALHRLVCTKLGYSNYHDDGQFPDVRHQLLEVKLQTSPTIDLGLVRPDSTEPLDVPQIERTQIRHCDVRYAIFCGTTEHQMVTLTHLILSTGQAFFARFPPFQGKVLNKKLQIHLPADFFGI